MKYWPDGFCGNAETKAGGVTDQTVDNEGGSNKVLETFDVVFWNLQNLFDLEGSVIASDMEYTPVRGWDRRALEVRIGNLADTIGSTFDDNGPDLLGICEIENARIANILIDAIGREDYALAHAPVHNAQGLDTALIYSTDVFTINEEASKGHAVDLTYATSDISEFHLTVKSNNADLVVLVNHWPSRKNGCQQSEASRLTAAQHCRRLVDENLKLSRKDYLNLTDNELSLLALNAAWNQNVLLMGDFNDEPWDRSIADVLGAVYSRDLLEDPLRFTGDTLPSFKSYQSRTARLFNPMWSLLTQPDTGTRQGHGANAKMELVDQFLLSRGLYLGLNGLQLETSDDGIPDVQIYRPDELCTRKLRPQEFRPELRAGYSDHFPITTTIRSFGVGEERS
ncbi:hypothetical protein [Fuerstiella marisgermanici]|uniref:Endonuclease/exonuclease/phosphatase domain-containing protein n=1 Tax=Fuerstiella marisgermanici TaxID=1891926 RepID=A0A1P8WGB7_9PLAN|nr:hypothetical protein [Fuerstiella marisgermanici]APZ93084.1 hypothetical protein Fuma_02700 [Fuerstiella marisgermanici]